MKTLRKSAVLFILLLGVLINTRSQSVCILSGVVDKNPICEKDNTNVNSNSIIHNLEDKPLTHDINNRSDMLAYLKNTVELSKKGLTVALKQEEYIDMQNSLIKYLKKKIKDKKENNNK